MDYTTFEPILEKQDFFDYSLGGYSRQEHRARTQQCLSTSIGAWKAEEYVMTHCYSCRERVLWLYNPNIFSQIRLRHEILELCYRNKTRMP
jgi:hypothetical protein